MSLRIKCKSATELASRTMDQRLSFYNRVALKLHYLVCAHCARYARQLNEIRRLLHLEWSADPQDAPALSMEARQRIETELHKKLES